MKDTELREVTKPELKASLRNSLRVSVRVTGSPASAREPDTP